MPNKPLPTSLPAPDLSLACVLSMTAEEWHDHIVGGIDLGALGTEELKNLERELARICATIVDRAVYLRWRLMLRKCGDHEAHVKATEHAQAACEAVVRHLMRRPKK